MKNTLDFNIFEKLWERLDLDLLSTIVIHHLSTFYNFQVAFSQKKTTKNLCLPLNP